MAEIRTVTTLVRKRDEIRASIRMYEKKIAPYPSGEHSSHEIEKKKSISLDEFNGLLEGDKAKSEQYLGIEVVLNALQEDPKRGNFRSRVFLRE